MIFIMIVKAVTQSATKKAQRNTEKYYKILLYKCLHKYLSGSP